MIVVFRRAPGGAVRRRAPLEINLEIHRAGLKVWTTFAEAPVRLKPDTTEMTHATARISTGRAADPFTKSPIHQLANFE